MDKFLVTAIQKSLQNSMAIKSLLVKKGVVTQQELDQEIATIETDGRTAAEELIAKLFANPRRN